MPCRERGRSDDRLFSLLNNSGAQRFPAGLSFTVSYVDTAAGTAGIGANCAAMPIAVYKDVRVGDTVEFAGVMFEMPDLAKKGVWLRQASK
ncbi:hypothetical protein ACIQMV_26925 [Streptomyces sp. NPDC091412]|uniref:hypothetical protein n=1 Tax=Streptomyces sp. NPDC091412 TaxID=3366002 RepID=UPI00382FC467